MTDRPILFSGQMVRAIIEGRKTQTRRVFRWQGPKGYPHSWDHAIIDNPAGVQRLLVPFNHPDDAHLAWGESGYHRHYGPADPGDRLWVRESIDKMAECGDDEIAYKADWPGDARGLGWRPSIHMPRWASRLTLTVTDVRVQRVQEISEADARAEGTDPTTCANVVAPADGFPSYRSAFGILWDSINAKRPGRSWSANPWVCAVSFSVIRKNIEDIACG